MLAVVLLRAGILVSEDLLFWFVWVILVVACGWVGLALVYVGLVLWLFVLLWFVGVGLLCSGGVGCLVCFGWFAWMARLVVV